MTLTYISCSSDFYTFYVNAPLSLGCMIRKVSAEDIAIRGNGTGLEYMCPTRHFVYIFFNPVFQVSTAKNEINLFNNHVLIVAPVTFAPAGAMTPSAEFLFIILKQETMYFDANGVDPDQTPHSVACDLGLHSLPMAFLRDIRHIWFKGEYLAIILKIFLISPSKHVALKNKITC